VRIGSPHPSSSRASRQAVAATTGPTLILDFLLHRDILFAVTEFLGTGSQVPLLLVIDAI
jgi:hypothetical protein